MLRAHICKFRFLSLLALLGFGWALAPLATAQLNVTSGYTANQYADFLVGGTSAVNISNVVLQGQARQFGRFDIGGAAWGNAFGMQKGIILSTGDTRNPPTAGVLQNNTDGPNNTSSRSTIVNSPGDANLQAIASGTVGDAASLRFDFVPFGDTVSFSFIFASEEYNEYAGSSFNDVFGFFITGPGFTPGQNIAVLPGTSTFITINNVNLNTNPAYYRSNDAPTPIGSRPFQNQLQFDGLTVKITITIPVVPCSTYTLKFAVGDVGDRSWDSAVFLEEGSFAVTGVENTAIGPNIDLDGNVFIYEGCDNALFQFARPPANSTVTIPVTISGSAIPGVDYQPLPSTITFSPGVDTVLVPLVAFWDAMLEPQETIMVIAPISNLCNTGLDTSLIIVRNVQPIVSVLPDTIGLCEGYTVNLNPILTGGIPDSLVYTWTDPLGNVVANTLSHSFPATLTGYYRLDVGSGCNIPHGKDSVWVQVTPSPTPNVTITHTQPTCNGDSDGTLQISVTGGTPPWSYSINGVNFIPFGNFFNLTAGQYTLYYIDQCSFLFDTVVTVTQPGPLRADSLVTPPKCFGGADGEIRILTTGGTGPFTYQWAAFPGVFDSIATGVSVGTYSCLITDSRGCQWTETVVVPQPTPFTLSTTTTDALCNGAFDGTATVTASGATPGYTYAWNTNPVQTGTTATGLGVGPHQVVVTDANGCKDSIVATVGQPQTMVLTMSGVNPLCGNTNDGTASVSIAGGTAPYDILWNTSPAQTTAGITGLGAGTYIVTVVDDNNCTETDSVVLTQPAPILANFTETPTKCFGSADGKLVVQGYNSVAPYSYQWQTSPPVNGNTLNNVPTGWYVVRITNGVGCVAFDSAFVTQPSPVQAFATSTDAQCFGANNGTAQATAAGGTPPYTFLWNTLPPVASPALINLAPGSYIVRAADANGCFGYDTAIVSQPGTIVIDSTSVTNLTCFGDGTGAAQVYLSGGIGPLTAHWNTTPQTPGTSLSGVQAGSYLFHVNDSTGCYKDTVFTITSPPALTATFGTAAANCYNDPTGAAFTLNIQGGVPAAAGYTVVWTLLDGTQDTSQFITNQLAGNYPVVVTDSVGCTFQQTVTIAQPTEFQLSLVPVPVTCLGVPDGKIFAFGFGGTGPYNFTWSNGQVGPAIIGLPAGTYQVVATDANGCPDTAITTITTPPPVTADVTTVDPTCHGLANGQATVLPNGGTPPYNFVWVTAPQQQYTQTATNLQAGTFFVKVFDNNGCREDVYFTLTAPAPVVPAIAPDTLGVCPGGMINFSASAAGGTPGYTYMWSDANNNLIPAGAMASVLMTGGNDTIHVVATDANGCTGWDTAVVTTWIPPVASFSAPPVSTCDLGLVDFDNTSQYASSFLWNFGDGNTSTLPEPSHIYYYPGSYNVTLTVTSPEGCVDSVTVPNVASLYAMPAARFTADPGNGSPLVLPDALMNFTSGSSNATQYVWHFGDGTTATGPTAQHTYTNTGTYWITLVVSNDIGCTDSTTWGPVEVILPQIQVPNVFTPNGDGFNDAFRIIAQGIATSKLVIYDRWGVLIYEGNVPVWNGNTRNGQPAAEGVYYYLYEATSIDGRSFTDRGSVTLVR